MLMKQPQSIYHNKIRVTFALLASIWADRIYLVGDFNDWDPTATPLRLDDRSWSVTLDLEPDRAYRYSYLLDNHEWMSDWNADRHVKELDGSYTSVVVTQPQQQCVGAAYAV